MAETLPENLQAERSAAIAWRELDTTAQNYVTARLNGTPPYPAARVAGFEKPGVRSQELEQDPRVLQYLQAATTARAHQQTVTRQDVLNGRVEGPVT